MELSVEQFLESVTNQNTKKEYRHGIKKFSDWYGKTAAETLELRKGDLTQTTGEGLIEYRNRAARFEREIEKFHGHLLTEGYTINTARNLTLGIRQLFRYYEMGIRFRAGSKVTKTVKTTRSFPLMIEHIRAMFQVADLRERVILSMATDLGLRIGDFLELKKTDLPPLSQEAPVSFDIMTNKEDVVAHSFLSHETVDLLKVYLPTLERKNGNPYLFPSNGKSHISDEWMNRLLQNLANKARIDLNGKDLTFHCFRKMFLSASVDSGIGLTAGMKLCGKTIAQSDDTYLTTVNLRQKFVQLKKFLTITEQPRVDTVKLDSLESAVISLQKGLTEQKTTTETMAKENMRMQQELKKLQPLVDFINSFDAPENLKTILNFLKDDLLDEYPDERFRPLRVEISPYISKQLEEIAKTNGITEKEALRQLVKDDLKMWENGEKKFGKLEERIKRERQKARK